MLSLGDGLKLYLVSLALELSRSLVYLHRLVLDLGHDDGKRQRKKRVLIVETAPLEDRLGSDYTLDRQAMDRGVVETFTIHEIMLESGPEADGGIPFCWWWVKPPNCILVLPLEVLHTFGYT